MTYNLRSYSGRAVEIGAKVGAGLGLAGGVLLAVSNESLRAEGSISIGYGMMALGVTYTLLGGVIGASLGAGLESLTEKLYHQDKLSKEL